MQGTAHHTNSTISLVLFIILSILPPVCLFAYNNEPDGYNGIKWGTNIDSLKNMRYLKTHPKNGKVTYYARQDDALTFGDAILKSVEYGFTDGKFFSVSLKVADILNYVAMKKAAFDRFGEGTAFDKFSERYFWEGQKTRITLVSAFDIS